MISQATVEVRNNLFDAPVLYLAPFGAEELGTVLPMNPSDMPYETASNAQALAELSPEEIAAELEAAPHADTFGIYAGVVQPDHFVGTVETKQFYQGQDAEGNPQFHRISQELGTHIYRPSEHGKGYGTLSKYAVMEYARSAHETHVFSARTFTENIAAQRSLQKLGFVLQLTDGAIRKADGNLGEVQHWMLLDGTAIDTFRANPETQVKFRPGWLHYLSLASNFSVQRIG
jgi:RimJ/RimL family protein N-acetyltransferase